MFEIFGVQFVWQAILDIGLVAIIFYNLILLVRGTRAVAVVYGLMLVLVVYFVSSRLNLFTLNTLLGEFLDAIFLVIIILFQKDIRKGLSQLGTGRFWFMKSQQIEDTILDELVHAVTAMAKERVGAIIVLEKNVPLGDIIERGVEIDARVKDELLRTIFNHETPLHDGAVVISRSRISAASCILPLSSKLRGNSMFGTRHRAALGISESTDAITIVVSEERGEISIAIGGRLTTSLDEVRLRRVIKNALER
ncbi:diadenylate cyclase CdaA [Salidesulfovibrio brasiliensis]|uniref:diadenylate cyclase CdaA n=1 Tax=Salidesulfovibrio brasiliensis TaxID=221711 RepID=UPI0006D207E0|nr:diadenylate cyclase CdaA [Salidesulfovibrio brasiliensis]